MNFLKKIPLSLFILIAVSFILFLHNLSKSQWREGKVIENDVGIYYSYLPATFIQNDPFFEHKMDYDSTSKYWTGETIIGRNVPKMSMGTAFLQLPFFLVADIYTQSDKKYLRDGLSEPYQHLIAFSSVFYTILGLICLRLFLKKYFSELVTSFVLIFIAFGTNLYYYSVYETGMSHTYTFFLFSILLLLFAKWKDYKSCWRSLLIGLIFGLIVLVRPINILFMLPIFMLFKTKKSSWKDYAIAYFKSYKTVVLIGIGFLAIWTPQLLFWKIQSGNFFYFSYGDEGFFWLHPHVFDGLFSFRKGWFIYTPMALFALFGMFRLYKTKKEWFWAISIFLPIFLYVTFSWWCWWYGGSFSARTLIDILPLIALPLAALLEWIFNKKWRSLLMLFPLFSIYLNLFQSWQYREGVIHYDSMTYEGYKESFFSSIPTIEYYEKLRAPDYENAKLSGQEKVVKHIQ